MRRLIFIMTIALMSLSCTRRPLTYTYMPTVEIVLNVDWSNMSEVPTGMSVYCYPESGESPTIKQTNDIHSTTLSLGVGTYKILVFNQVPSEFSTITFSGFNNFETANVCASTTTSNWYTTLDDDEILAAEPAELAIATYQSVTVTEEAFEEVFGLHEQYDYSQEVAPYQTINVKPDVVVKLTRVTVELEGICNLGAARSTLYGMATGYDISTHMANESSVTNLLDQWTMMCYVDDVNQGYIRTYFTCFGLPEMSNETREVDESWEGVLHLEMQSVDGLTVETRDYMLYDKTTILVDDEQEDKYEDKYVDISIDIHDDISSLANDDNDDEVPDDDSDDSDDSDDDSSTSSTGGFNAEVTDWEDEEKVQVGI